MNYDTYIPLEDAGVYSIGDGKSAWQDVSPQGLRDLLQGGNAPLFRTALAKTGEDEFAGPFYIDIDSGDIEEATHSLRALLDKLADTGLNLDCVRLFATGGKGFHLEIPQACFTVQAGPVIGLPRVYKALALSLYVDGLDLRVYSSGKGRLWRVPNLLRDNGAYKVPVTLAEVQGMNPASYAALCSAPREFPPLATPEYCPGLADLHLAARESQAKRKTRVRSWSQAEATLRDRFKGECPPSIKAVLAGEVQSPLGLNALALQVSLLAHVLDWSAERLLVEAAGMVREHAGDGHRYGTAAKREREMVRMWHYTEGNTDYSFSIAGLRSVLPAGSFAPDLAGIEADRPEDAPDYADLLDCADGPGAVVAVARQIAVDPALSRTESEALIKRAAKSAGVAVKVLRSDLWGPSEAGGTFIEIRHNDYAGSVDSALQVLPSVPGLRVRAGELVELRGGRVTLVQLPRLAYLLSNAARWRYPEGIGGPDTSILQGVMAAGAWPGVPELLGVAHAPTILHGGSVGALKGYEPDYNPADFPPYPGTGAEALAELRGLLAEFAFASRTDEAAAIAAILTAVARPTLRTAPAFLVSAFDLGSGKTYLAELIALFAAPDVEMLRWAGRTDEQDKMLLSLLREGRTALLFDNLLRDWHSATLAAILTSPTYSDRLLGASKAISVSTRCLVLATGNNVKASLDMSRRCVTIKLDPRCENPLSRAFKGNPVTEVHANRGRWVMAALKVLQEFLARGGKPVLTPLASFDEWSKLIRGSLAYYGLPDIAAGVVAQVEGDSDRELFGLVLQAWHEAFGSEPLTLRDIVSTTTGACPDTAKGGLRCLFTEIAGRGIEIDFRSLGNWLSSRTGQVVGGLRLVSAERTYKGALWQVVTLTR